MIQKKMKMKKKMFLNKRVKMRRKKKINLQSWEKIRVISD